MSYDDFCLCTFDEFEAICEAWRGMAEGRNRAAWERTRISAAISIQPHVRKRITARQLLPLPWDNQRRHNAPDAPELTPDERRQRFEDAMHRLGDEITQ